jgi:GDP/UDP-N,N'-diacetylbacillosamine 2-epimerase (hydrolysing)
MKKKICVVTATRAEYGLLKPLILALAGDNAFDVAVAVTGAHLSSEFGCTYRDIENDGIRIDVKIDMLLDADSPAAVSKSMGLAVMGFADYFAKSKPDLLILLGDRYEMLSVAIAAMNERIPIAHLHGGETSQGAIDEAIRHSLTKMSLLHFTSTEEHRRRVIQLGESPARVFNVGAVGAENAVKMELLSKNELERDFGISLTAPYAAATFHPATLEEQSAETQIKALLESCLCFPDILFIFTKSNADTGGRSVNLLIDAFAKENGNIRAFASLGARRYLSTIKYADFVIGNSSSGLIEAPCFGIPTVNIGDRQKGRTRGESVIDCEVSTEKINRAISLALSEEMRERAQKSGNPYLKEDAVENIVAEIKKFDFRRAPNLMKEFYDYEQNPARA